MATHPECPPLPSSCSSSTSSSSPFTRRVRSWTITASSSFPSSVRPRSTSDLCTTTSQHHRHRRTRTATETSHSFPFPPFSFSNESKSTLPLSRKRRSQRSIFSALSSSLSSCSTPPPSLSSSIPLGAPGVDKEKPATAEINQPIRVTPPRLIDDARYRCNHYSHTLSSGTTHEKNGFCNAWLIGEAAAMVTPLLRHNVGGGYYSRWGIALVAIVLLSLPFTFVLLLLVLMLLLRVFLRAGSFVLDLVARKKALSRDRGSYLKQSISPSSYSSSVGMVVMKKQKEK